MTLTPRPMANTPLPAPLPVATLIGALLVSLALWGVIIYGALQIAGRCG